MSLWRFLLVGSVTGWIIGKIRRGYGYGLLGNLAVGAAGAAIGWWIAGFLNIALTNIVLEITMAVVGAIVIFLVLGLLRRKRSPKESNV